MLMVSNFSACFNVCFLIFVSEVDMWFVSNSSPLMIVLVHAALGPNMNAYQIVRLSLTPVSSAYNDTNFSELSPFLIGSPFSVFSMSKFR